MFVIPEKGEKWTIFNSFTDIKAQKLHLQWKKCCRGGGGNKLTFV